MSQTPAAAAVRRKRPLRGGLDPRSPDEIPCPKVRVGSRRIPIPDNLHKCCCELCQAGKGLSRGFWPRYYQGHPPRPILEQVDWGRLLSYECHLENHELDLPADEGQRIAERRMSEHQAAEERLHVRTRRAMTCCAACIGCGGLCDGSKKHLGFSFCLSCWSANRKEIRRGWCENPFFSQPDVSTAVTEQTQQ